MLVIHFKLILLALAAGTCASHSDLQRRAPGPDGEKPTEAVAPSNSSNTVKVDPLAARMPSISNLTDILEIHDQPTQAITDFITSDRHRDDDRYVLLLLGPESQWKDNWSAVKQEYERSSSPKVPDAIIHDLQAYAWSAAFPGNFDEYNAQDKKSPLKNWIYDLIKEFRFPKELKGGGAIRHISYNWESIWRERFDRFTGMNFFLKNLPKDPSSVKDFAEILRNDTFITIGEDEKGNAKAKKERIRLMTFVVGVDYPFITKMDEPTTGNRTLDFPKTKREELLKSLQSDLGAEVMQYVGKIIVLMK